MLNNNTQNPNSDQNKGNNLKLQINKVRNALKIRPMTMKEIDSYTGIMRENVCRHIDTLRKQGEVKFIRKRICTITNNANVGEYTANASLFPKSNQLKLDF